MDLNCDLGESYSAWTMGDDTAMLGVVSSANIACGFHGGDPAVMLKTVRHAASRNVTIGAHVSYPDRAGFGRRDMDLTSEELTSDVIYQLGALMGMARAAGTQVRYVKPHGALYNHIAHNQRQGLAVIQAIKLVDPSLVLMGLAGTPVLELARAEGLAVMPEIFADRGYTPQGLLVSRRDPGAVLHDADQAAQRMLNFVRTGRLAANDGTELRIAAGSICVHGDSQGAVAMAQAIRRLFEAEGICVKAFV